VTDISTQPDRPTSLCQGQEWLEIGKIVAAQGVKGQLRVISYSDFPERFTKTGQRWIQRCPKSSPQPIELRNGRAIPGKANMYIITLAGIETRDQAEALRDGLLLVAADDRPELEEGEYHIDDLIGCAVFLQATRELIGTVQSMFVAGNDLLEVKAIASDKTVLIPFVEAIVPVVDPIAKRIEITPPLGLIDDLFRELESQE
jgi:16S rRNA processing protein RimM